MFTAACIQLQGSSNVARNLSVTEALVRRAAAMGCALVATPEATTYLGPHDRKIQLAEPVDGPTHRRLGALAAELGIHLLIGSVAEKAQGDPGRCHNTSLLFGPDGTLLSSYRKMHLFDVDIPGGVRFSESATCAPGREPVVADTALGRLGLTI